MSLVIGLYMVISDKIIVLREEVIGKSLLFTSYIFFRYLAEMDNV